jgi:dihydroorotase
VEPLFIDMPNTVPNVLTTEILDEKFRIAAENLGLTFPSFLGVNKDNLDKVLEMDTTQFGVSDDGLYFTKKEICLPIVQIQWRNFF